MRLDYLNKIKNRNGWFWDCNNTYYLVVTDDLDSLLSALLILQYRPNWKIGFFYDYNVGIYKRLDIPTDINITDTNIVFVDCSVPCIGIKCISNHVVKISPKDPVNTSDINLNILDNICVANYHNKYNLNTLILVYSLLGLKPCSNAESAMLLLPDSAFLAYFANRNYRDYYVQKRYLVDVLKLPELFNLLQQVNKLQRWKNGQVALNMYTKLEVTDMGIETVEDVDLVGICKMLKINTSTLNKLKGCYGLTERHRPHTGSTNAYYNKSNMLSFAVINKNKVVYSCKI